MAEEEKKEALAPIIIIKKKGGHGGHHGGAWKVAYADFVTAMMALFIVLWLLSSSDQVKKAVSSYFNDPSGAGKDKGSGAAGTGETVSVGETDMDKLKDKLEAAMKQAPDFEKLKDNVAMSVTGDGLRIEMLESEKGMFFQSGKPTPSDTGEEVIKLMAAELGKMPNDLLIEGHTDATPLGAKGGEYTNWELSVDRANAARRLMEGSGLRPGQVVQVRGFADRQLRDKEQPDAASNRRVSVIVKYQSAPSPPEGKGEAKEGERMAGEHGEAPHEKSEETKAAPEEHKAATGEHTPEPKAEAKPEPAKAPVADEPKPEPVKKAPAKKWSPKKAAKKSVKAARSPDVRAEAL